MSNPNTFFVFDVESIGLHGEGFAVAGGVYFTDGTVDKGSEFAYSCLPSLAQGEEEDRVWISENVPALPVTHPSLQEMRYDFWRNWESAKERYPNLVMTGECVWPVEAGFLSACVKDNIGARKWFGPYPLHEIASFMVAAGMDPMATYDRLESEMPKHHPLGDVRQSSRLLCEALEKLDAIES